MKRILVIDDDYMVRTMLRMTLESKGYAVTEAADGKEGLKRFAEFPADVIITDLVMPEKEGLETISELKKIMPEVNIIAISGGGKIGPEGYLTVAKSLGAKYTFTKPVNKEKLLEAIQTLIPG